MKQLSTYPIYRTFYAKRGIIYAIENSIKPNSDEHAIIYDENDAHGLTSKIILFDKNGTYIKSYSLDSLVEDGDEITSNDNPIPYGFMKNCHTCSSETNLTLYDYYKHLCEQQIAKVIADTAQSNGYKYYYDESKGINRLSLLGVPDFMFTQNYPDYSDTQEAIGVCIKCDGSLDYYNKMQLINFTKAKYNRLLNEEIYRRAKKAANNAINKYGKQVGTLTLIDM